MKEFNSEREAVIGRGNIDLAEERSGFDVDALKPPEPKPEWVKHPYIHFGLPVR